MAKMEFLYMTRSVLSGPPLVHWIGNQKTDGKYWVKPWTAILVEVFHPGSPHLFLRQEDLRENEEVEPERER